MVHHQPASDNQSEGIRRKQLKAKSADSKKRADTNLRAIACRAVEAGLPVSEVAKATGYCPATLKRWLADKPESGVRVLPILEDPVVAKPHTKNSDSPIASLEIGSFTIRFYSR